MKERVDVRGEKRGREVEVKVKERVKVRGEGREAGVKERGER